MNYNDTLFEAVLGNGKRLRSGPGGSIKKWSILSDYTSPSDEWSFSFVSSSQSDRRALDMMPVQIYIDGRLQVPGRVGKTRRGRKTDGSLVNLEGFDYIHDILECQVDPSVIVAPGDTLDQVVLRVLKPCGVVAIEEPEKTIEARTGRPPSNMLPKLVKADMQNTKPTPNCGCYQFVKQIVTRHGYMLQPSVNSALVCIEKPNYLQKPIYDIIRLDASGAGGNTIDSEAVSDCSTFPTFAKFVGASGAAAEKRAVNNTEWDLHAIAKGLSDDLYESISKWCWQGRRLPKDCPPMNAGQLYRLMYFEDKLAKTPAQVGAAVMRAAFDQLKKSLSYEVELKGTRDIKTGATYAVNTIAKVSDSVANVHEMLWAHRCVKVGDEGGVKTTMSFWRPGSYQIDKEGHGG